MTQSHYVNKSLLLALSLVFGRRLAEARKRAGLSQVGLAAALGDRYDQTMISHVEGNRRVLRIDGLTHAARELQVSTDYLTGLTDDPTPAAKLAKALARERVNKVSELEDAGALATADDSHEFRPVLLTQGTGIAAGAGANADDERVLGSLAFRDDWLRRHSLNPKRCRVIEVTGDSMEPTLQRRAMILVDFQRTVRRQNKIFAVRTEDGPLVKRLQHADGKGWRLVSDNPAYKPVPWPDEAVVLGQVMWTGRTL